MVKIEDNQNCCGCEACVQECPKHCITLIKDKEGFYYPKVDETFCIHCNLCEKVCLFNSNKIVAPLEKLYAYKNNDKQVVKNSSSGGAFTALASLIIKTGGVVFGAAFDTDWNVHHIYIDKIKDLYLLRGSKYVQSHIGNTYQQAEFFLKTGRNVLYSGTPCQIKGLKSYLKREYNNLLAVDFICHGVPSPGIWNSYLTELIKEKGKKLNIEFDNKTNIANIKFREKKNGWQKYRFVVYGNSDSNHNENIVLWSGIHSKNPFMKGFLSNVYLRPSCYACPVKKGSSGCDIQMGDFWGIKEIKRSFYSKDGISMLIAQSEKGDIICRKISGELLPIHTNITLFNPSYSKSSPIPPKRKIFFTRYEHEDFIPLINEITKVSFLSRIYFLIRLCLAGIGINHKINELIQKWRKK